MARIRLLLDEDTRLLLAPTLRSGGHDVVHVNELGMQETDDSDVLKFAVSEHRAVFTHNAQDYMPLAAEYARSARPHWGILVSAQAPFAELRLRLLRFLGERTAEEIRDVPLWLP